MSKCKLVVLALGVLLAGESCLVSPLAFAAAKTPELRLSKKPALGRMKVPAMRNAKIPSLSSFMNPRKPAVKKPVAVKTPALTRSGTR